MVDRSSQSSKQPIKRLCCLRFSFTQRTHRTQCKRLRCVRLHRNRASVVLVFWEHVWCWRCLLHSVLYVRFYRATLCKLGVCYTASLSVCPSVCLSLSWTVSVNTIEHFIKRCTFVPASTIVLVFSYQISSRNSDESHSIGALNTAAVCYNSRFSTNICVTNSCLSRERWNVGSSSSITSLSAVVFFRSVLMKCSSVTRDQQPLSPCLLANSTLDVCSLPYLHLVNSLHFRISYNSR